MIVRIPDTRNRYAGLRCPILDKVMHMLSMRLIRLFLYYRLQQRVGLCQRHLGVQDSFERVGNGEKENNLSRNSFV